METEKLLEKLVSVNSSFPNERRIGEMLERLLRERGFTVKRQYISKDRFNILAERGKGNEAILFYGHMDTVPINGTWATNPLKLTSKQDKLYGLGARDMKCDLAAMIHSSEKSQNRKIKFLICVDEENISEGAWSAVMRSKPWFRDVKLIISGDGANSSKSEGGANVLTLGRRGRCVYTLKVQGIPAHGADARKGISAIDEAAKIVCNLSRLKLRKHIYLGDERVFTRMITSTSNSLSLPEEAMLEFDVHLVPPSTKETFRTNIEVFINELKSKNILKNETKITVAIKNRKTPYLDAYLTNMSNTKVSKTIWIMKKAYGNLIFNYGNSVSDDNVLANSLKIPIITIWPLGGNAHAGNEWVSRKSLNQVAKLYGLLINQL